MPLKGSPKLGRVRIGSSGAPHNNYVEAMQHMLMLAERLAHITLQPVSDDRFRRRTARNGEAKATVRQGRFAREYREQSVAGLAAAVEGRRVLRRPEQAVRSRQAATSGCPTPRR